ncbi:hypothetical protein JJD41_08235 [Oxynema sp. CENA135]|uniref:hypothetical protein n=1 Tax=Oxynema sp. CENA135 TaxID=984206 RepID=UPI00190AF870|nr:hypothetical protein [Oxynema sp. CENA135]MBK4729852.1 hypothetical protein [Oxynema sp. CENA135]
MTESKLPTSISMLAKDTLIKLPTHKFYRQTFMFDEMLSIALWSVTRISYDVKCLVDGTRGRAIAPNGGWEMGTVRLLALLNLKVRAEETHLQLDCLTRDSPRAILPNTAVIQCDNNQVCREPRQVGELVKELKEELQTACAEMTDFLVPTRLGFPTIEFLEPGQQWRYAELRVDLEMSFVSDYGQSDNGQPNSDRHLAQPLSPLGDRPSSGF